jgi:predicted membrane metal-binding protein
MSPNKEGFSRESATLFTLSVAAGLVLGIAVGTVLGNGGIGLLAGLAVGMLFGYLAIFSGRKRGKT